MQVKIKHHTKEYLIDLSKPLDISIPLQATENNPLAWYIEKPEITPVKLGDWIGSRAAGADVNFNNIYFNPHAHGTHTECVGHISKEFHSINTSLTTYFFFAEVVSVTPQEKGVDQIITLHAIKTALNGKKPQAIIIRTLPNQASKKTQKYSNTNWPYLAATAAQYLHDIGVQHLLIDLPSVDKEKDDGALAAHKAFWNYPENPRLEATITEFIYVPAKIEDGTYILNLQTAPFVNDATPSRPVLYKLL